MTVPSFMILAAACAPAIHPMMLSAVVMQESRGSIYAVGLNDDHKLSHQSSTLKEVIAITKKLKQDGHNFDMGLGQINAKNLKWFSMSLSNLFDPCKNFKAAQAALTYCYERAILACSSEQTALQAALSYYNTVSFKSGSINLSTNAYVQKVASYVGEKIPVRLSQKPQKSIELHTAEPEQAIKTEPLSSTSEELPDAFTQKESGAHDAFTVEDASFRKEGE
ncbi:lytic transglycosylase domain-containing protein [Bartonella heixiaziensis]|uniref:lytic transglycosylase domain-containing protein n=1 Tax=Bartonella heixiaziensis TaxID=1461000 RepID=UPI003D1D9E12